MSSVVDSQKSCEWQQTVLSLLSNLKTRDAMYRVVQFSLRVVLAVRSICAASPHSAGLFARLVAAVAPKSAFDAKLMSAVAALATGRKVLAFGNVVSEVPNLHRLVSSLFSVSCFRFCCFRISQLFGDETQKSTTLASDQRRCFQLCGHCA